MTYVARDDAPSFCYTTGIFRTFSIPEIFISSLPPNLSHELVTQYVARFSHSTPPVNVRIGAAKERFDYFLVPVLPNRLQNFVLASYQFYNDEPFDCLQLIYPDTSLRFPHEDGYDYDQEILGEYASE
ncbi:MAG: DUF4262 domain-containing protein [Planctomycetaceae bacterium]|nr:DUF4262 domain-containing protein [Planctomycetaceae bacterium]MCB9951891.1 DUF4262 domain-containing protein [Planctomycetaceae bacterium]